jgi:sugar phosphate isomerase/epimerase
VISGNISEEYTGGAPRSSKRFDEMKLFISVPLSRFDDLIDDVEAGGFHPEIRMTSADHLAGMGESEFARIRDILRKRTLSTFTHGPFFGLDIASLDRCLSEYSADCLLTGLEATRAMGGELMVMHTGYLPQFSRGGKRHWFRNWAERMPRILDRAGELGVTVALENTWDDRPEVLEHLAGLVPGDRLRFCLDTGHVNAFSRISIGRWWKGIGDRVVALHLHDNDGLSDDHLAPGRGTFDFEDLSRLVRESGSTPLHDLEVDMSRAAEGKRYLERVGLWTT